jgi:adenylate cyclase
MDIGLCLEMPSDNRRRMDFISEVVSIDADTGHVELRVQPDPRRYKWIVMEGKKYLHDLLDRELIPEDVFIEGVKTFAGLPTYCHDSKIDDSDAYVESRTHPIRSILDEGGSTYSFEDKSEEFLQALVNESLGFAILSIDMVNSTALSGSSDARKYGKIVCTLLSELSEVVPAFHGYVLKYTGDGLIAYFPEPNYVGKNDMAIRCAQLMRRVVYEAINPELESLGLSKLQVRIGLESGDAVIVSLGSPSAKHQRDIIGSVISLAAKIEKEARPGEILMGESLNRNIHTSWRLQCEEVEVSSSWLDKNTIGSSYRLFRLNDA